MILWTDKSAALATSGKAQGTWQASRVEIDSRRVQPGDLFLALKGENFDGHDFVADALKKGAVAAVVNGSLPHRGRVGVGADFGEIKNQNAEQECPSPSLPPNGGGAVAAHRYPIAQTLANARELRKNMTDAEQLLWQMLRREQLGVKFRKQHPVGKYIADFACLNPKLIVELDGGQHNEEAVIKKDEARTRFLEQQGFAMLRFWNNDVLENIEGVLETIYSTVHNKSPHPNPPPTGEGMLIVPDTQKALEDLGRYARQNSKAKIVGVTGSVGKTSAKEMLRLALSAHGKTYASSGNFNNHIGTPLNLANLPPDAGFAVFEMGMNHPGEIAHLTRMVQPHVAAITNVEAVHMEFFPSLEAIADAKAEIFEGLQKGGAAILNADNPHYAHLKQAALDEGATRLESFGESVGAGCRLISYRATPTGCAIEADIFGKRLHYTLEAVGKHWAMTSLLTLAVTHALGLDDEKTAKALAGFSEMDGRGRIIPLGDSILIDDSYNASPASMRAAFAKTAEVWESGGKSGRKLAALGNMLELGPDSPKLHAALAKDLQAAGFDGVFTAGELMKHLHDALPASMRAGHAAKAMDVLPLLQKQLCSGDILLVKGSHGSKMYELVNALKDSGNENFSSPNPESRIPAPGGKYAL